LDGEEYGGNFTFKASQTICPADRPIYCINRKDNKKFADPCVKGTYYDC